MGLSFGDLELDLSLFELRRDGARVPLEPQAFDVLTYLVEHRDRVISKEELMDQIWGGRFVSETAITSRIKQVRRAVGDDGRTQSVIKTVHGRGYRFAADLTDRPEVHDQDPAPGIAATVPAPTVRIAGQITRTDGLTPQPTRPVVGRDPERAVLRAAFDQAQQGAGRTVVIGGEPGIGKSTLLAELTTYAREHDARVLSGRAIASAAAYRPLTDALMGPLRAGELVDSESLRPFRSALGRVLPGWAFDSPPEPGVDPVLMVSEGLLRILLEFRGPGESRGRSCVLALEDLHDADADTLAVLSHLSTAITQLPLLIVATCRDWPRSDALQRLLSGSDLIRLPLTRLSEAEVAELVDSLRDLPAAVREQLVRQSEGLPLVVAELADGVAEPGASVRPWAVQQTFSALTHARLASLSEPERRLLAAAAVLGPSPNWDLVPRVAGVGDQQAVAGLRHAVELHLLVADGDELSWRHGLTRQVIRSTLLPPERRLLSLAAAKVLLTAGDDGGAADLLLRAGEPDRAADIFVSLARRALAGGALGTADEALARASATGRRSVAVAALRVELLVLAGRSAEALTVGAGAVADARGDEHAELCLQLARAAVAVGRWGVADDWVTRAGRPNEQQSLVVLADSAHGAGRVAEAREYARIAVAAARAGEPPEVLCEALCTAARVSRLDRLDEARRDFAEAAQLASEFGLHPWRATALFGLGTVMLLDEEGFDLAVAREAALDLGLLGRVAMIDLLLADSRLAREGPTTIDTTVATLAEHEGVLGIPVLRHAIEVLLATGAAMAGQPKAMEEHLGRLELPDVPLDNRAQLVVVRAEAALMEHDVDAAARLLDTAVVPLLDHGSAAPLLQFGLWALVAARVGTFDQSAQARLANHPAMLRRANQGAVRYASAVIAGRAGDRAAAEAEFAAAESLLSPVRWWHRFLRQITLEAAVVDGWGDPVPLLRADLAAFEQGGDVALARIGRELLRRAGAPTRRGRGDSEVPPAMRASGLTSRELDVLRLIDSGLSNQAISERLFLSPRTVETHVANLLAKSGTANRHELRAWSAALTP